MWGTRPGARQRITEKGRLIELRVRILLTFALIGGVQIMMVLCLATLGLIDYSIVELVIENIRLAIACLLSPIFFILPLLLYVIIRDIIDPNFEPLNAVIERTSPLWPWRGVAQRIISFVKGRFMQ